MTHKHDFDVLMITEECACCGERRVTRKRTRYEDFREILTHVRQGVLDKETALMHTRSPEMVAQLEAIEVCQHPAESRVGWTCTDGNYRERCTTCQRVYTHPGMFILEKES